jgi:hypothetical protein
MADEEQPADHSKYWQEQLDLAKKDHQEWLESGDEVVKRYKRGKEKGGQKKLNILYSNTEHLRAALYGRSAKPDVRRRFGSEDKIASIAGEVIEKGLVYVNETYDNDRQIELGILDYLLPGRGVIRVEYEPVIVDGQITKQKLCDQFVYWKDFLCMPARTWGDIQKNGWVSFRHTMTRDELVNNFGDVGSEVPLNWSPDIADRAQKPDDDSLTKAEVYEIWDVVSKSRYWIVEGFDRTLRVDPDPYGLEDFFPLPEPPAYYFTTDTIIPDPEFHVYKDQADDLDEITNRISRLTKALKRRGVYDASFKELQRLATAGDNVFLPVENYAALASKGGLEKSFETEDISVIAGVLVQLYQYRDLLIQAIWELIGIADIMRGSSAASETLGAQELKAQFGSQRLKRRQRTIQHWVAGLLKIKAEILAEHFEPEILQEMTGVMLVPPPPPPPPQLTGDPQQDQMMIQQFTQAQQAHQAQVQEIQGVMELLRSDKLRSYRIDVETDSTVFEDAEAEKASRGKMIEAITLFIQAWGPAAAAAPEIGPLAFELLKFGIGPFKGTRQIDDAIEQAATAFASKPPQQDPAAQAEAQKVQLEQQKAQAEQQMAMAEEQREERKFQREMRLREAEATQKMDLEKYKVAETVKLEQWKAKQDADLEKDKFSNQLVMEDIKFEKQSELEDKKISAKRETDNRKIDNDRELEEKRIEYTRPKVDMKLTADEVASSLSQVMPDTSGPMKEVAEALAAIAQGQQQTAEALRALAAPRRRVAVRDDDGRMVEAHDMPMES